MTVVPSERRGGLPGLLDALKDLHVRAETGVLGLVLSTEGSTYQKPGAVVLLGSPGMIHGAISGGCLEPELEDRAREVQRTEQATVIEFDTRSDEDLIFGSGTGCRGRVQLLLLPQPPAAPLTRALHALAAHADMLDVGVVAASPHTGCGYARLADRLYTWTRDGRTASIAGLQATHRIRIAAPPRVLLFGAGAETLPLNVMTRQLGWLLQVVEHRGRWLAFARAAGVSQTIERPPEEAAEVWRQQRFEAAIAMTHNYALDMQNLALCAPTELSYIGILGPSARRDSMLVELDVEVTKLLHGRLHAPVGLDLGGRGPESIALSIVAELQQHFSRRSH